MHESEVEYDYARQEIPADLVPYYQFLARDARTHELHRMPFGVSQEYRSWFLAHEGVWAYACPECKAIFPPGLGGMPGSFRAHIAGLDKEGCVFKPKKATQSQRKNELSKF